MLLKKGSTGVNVKLLQNNLKVLCYDSYSIDGIFGNDTCNSVVRYQKDNNLIIDGIVGDNTWNKIINDIREIQEALNDKGYDLAIDGLAGINTYNAILNFQSDNGLVADGIVGPSTRSNLFSCQNADASTDSDISDNNFDISPEGINFIADYEDFYPNAYRGLDYQNETIGFGHVITKGETFTTLTEDNAKDLLKKDLESFVYLVNKMLEGININQHQFDALVSFSYNCGVTALKNSTLLKDIKAGACNETIKEDFLMWCNCNKERALGLYRRRFDEFDIFSYADYTRKYRTFE